MLKNKWQILTLTNLVLLIGLISFLLFKFFITSHEIVYVDNVKLFDGFRMTKDMKSIGEKEFSSKKAYLDSLYLELQSNMNEKEKEFLMKEFVSKREEFDQFNASFAANESEKIWIRINSYSKEFSKVNNYKLVIGSETKRDVIFADEQIDVTNALLVYINKRYEGL